MFSLCHSKIQSSKRRKRCCFQSIMPLVLLRLQIIDPTVIDRLLSCLTIECICVCLCASVILPAIRNLSPHGILVRPLPSSSSTLSHLVFLPFYFSRTPHGDGPGSPERCIRWLRRVGRGRLHFEDSVQLCKDVYSDGSWSHL